jgi:hypothetical protein
MVPMAMVLISVRDRLCFERSLPAICLVSRGAGNQRSVVLGAKRICFLRGYAGADCLDKCRSCFSESWVLDANGLDPRLVFFQLATSDPSLLCMQFEVSNLCMDRATSRYFSFIGFETEPADQPVNPVHWVSILPMRRSRFCSAQQS